MYRNRLRFLLLTSILSGTACDPGLELNAPGTGQAASLTEIQITGSDFHFAPGTLRVPLNHSVKLVFKNEGKMAHDWVVQGLDTPLHLNAEPGHTESKTVRFDKAGAYPVACTIPGHKDYGMAGTLIVGNGGSAQPEAETLAAPPTLARLPQPQVVPPVNRSIPATVPVALETREVEATLADGVTHTFWTFGGTIPGPMIRVRQGDTVAVTLANSLKSQLTHSIDLHAVNGPGGGARDTQVPPGGYAAFSFQALNPGVYVYHCATPKVAHHIANGMYGLIVVEPPQGFSQVDREFYVMQGDFYHTGPQGSAWNKLLDEKPDYVLFNGGVGAVKLAASQGETVRFVFGVGGPNLTSSFHLIGEIFDKVYPEGASEALSNIQTTLVPAGGATLAEARLETPGTYLLVDHSLGRLEKGAAGTLTVTGTADPAVYQPLGSGQPEAGGHGDSH